MFESMTTALTIAAIMAGVVALAAVFAEGRGAHLLNMLRGRTRDGGVEFVYSEVERDAHDWELVGRINSIPEDVTGAARAKELALHAVEGTKNAVAAGRERLAQRQESPAPAEAPRTGEWAVSQH